MSIPSYAEIQDYWQQIDSGIATIRNELITRLVTPEWGVISVANLTGEESTQLCSVVLPHESTTLGLTGPDGKPAVVTSTRKVDDRQVEITFLANKIPAMGVSNYNIISSEPTGVISLPQPVIENQRFRIEADQHGLLVVFDKSLGQPILLADEYRPGELILEHDEGSPWATIHPDQTRTTLAPYTQLVAAETGSTAPGSNAPFQRLVFEVSYSLVNGLWQP